MTWLLKPTSLRPIYGFGIALALSLTVACGSAATPAATVPPATTATTIPVSPAQENSEASLTAILATKVLRVGTQRVSFLLTSPKALVKAPEATVTTRFLEGKGANTETKQAKFLIWPYGVRGSYSTELTFDRPGRWQLDIIVDDERYAGEARLIVDVAEQAGIPDIGAIPPRSQNKTLATVGSIEDLTTDSTPDPDLYQLTIGEAIASSKPSVIVFATPAFCTSPTCGPQVDAVEELKNAHQGEANFIHVEFYDNPTEIQGDLSRAVLAEAVKEWRINEIPEWFNESWTFILNDEGRIEHKYEGFVTLVELEEALQRVLEQG